MKIQNAPQDIATSYSKIIEEGIECLRNNTWQGNTLEQQIWDEIGTKDYDLADSLTSLYTYEIALRAAEQNIMPIDNVYFQSLVVRMAYNAITNADEFVSIVQHSFFDEKTVQKLIDMAAMAVVWNKNFDVDEFMYFQQRDANYLQYLYCSCERHAGRVLSHPELSK